MTPGKGLHWRVDGAGSNLVLIHGWALALDYWDTVVPLLAPHFRVLRFDRRGFGASGGTPSLDADRDDLLTLMDRADMPQAAVVGMSQGARVAVAAALAYPQRVRALILDGPPWLGDAGPSSSEAAEQELPLRQLRALLRQAGEPALQQAVLDLPLMRLVNTTAAASTALAHCVVTYRGKDFASAVRLQNPLPVRELAQPVLIVNGARDTAHRLDAAVRLQQQITACRRCTLADAGHLAALDAPQRYCHAIIEFLQQGQ